MRLLNIDTLEFCEFPGDEIPPYLVTSHRWSRDEATYKDVLKRRNTDSLGFKKIVNFCDFARQLYTNAVNHLARNKVGRWIWIDTCCINQNSSAEVSESINSMWEWYKLADHCIAYLQDVRPLRAGWEVVMHDFRRSEWWERGWTLQELLAPGCVIFLTQEWEIIGRKSHGYHDCGVTNEVLSSAITDVTGIAEHVLYGSKPYWDNVTKETKMTWAANRRTTKAEDAAYCLLGIFDVHMPMIYGEGERHARKRLELEISARALEVEEAQDHQLAQETPGGVEIVEANHQCPVCQLQLYEPMTTTCNHTICEACMMNHEKLNMVPVPLKCGGQAEGDAATRNFECLQHCPVCGTRSLNDTSMLLAAPDPALAKAVRLNCPRTYAERAARTDQTADEGTFGLTITVGNWHQLIKANHHSWKFFVKPSRTDTIKEVHMELHESFRHPHVVRKRPPYSLDGSGWGYFTIDIRVVLNAGLIWLVSDDDVENGPDGAPMAALKLMWTLDFASHGGRGAVGRCKVKVKKERRGALEDLLANHDQDFSFPSIEYNPAAAFPPRTPSHAAIEDG